MLRWLRLSIVLAVVAGGVIAAWHWPALPERVASHFDGAGRPDGWTSRGSFVGLMLGMTVFHAAVFLGLEQLVRRSPKRWINLPHKEEWLAPGREARTREVLAAHLLALGLATIVLVDLLTAMTLATNAGGAPRLGAGVWILLAGFVAATLAIVVRMLVVFGRRPAGTD
jgi:serine/threonine-protein kinase